MSEDFNGILPSEPGDSGNGGSYYYPETGPSVHVSVYGIDVGAGESYSSGFVVQNSSKVVVVTISNSGVINSTLFIPMGGISAAGNGSITNSPVQNTGRSLINPSSSSISFTVVLDTSSVGIKEVRLSVVSNDPSDNPFRFKIAFSVVTAPVLPSISLTYNNSTVANNSILTLGNYPLSGLNTISLNITNSGTPDLTIPQNGISLTSINDGVTFSSNPVANSAVSIPFNTSASFSLLLDTTSLGQKTVIITLVSNDTSNDPYIITVSYNISKSFNLVVEENSISLTHQEVVDIGTYDKKKSIVKRISLSNDGIFHNIRVLGIVAEGHISLRNIPALPFILQANKLNVAQFQANFDSLVLGIRTGDIKIQWEVAS